MTEWDVLRGAALALRDVTEVIGGTAISVTLEGMDLTWNVDDGFHVVLPAGEPIDIDEWVDDPGLLPVPGVESVREQMRLRAAVAGADAWS